MPSEINLKINFINFFIFILLQFLVSIFPAIKASKLDPVKGLKYE